MNWLWTSLVVLAVSAPPEVQVRTLDGAAQRGALQQLATEQVTLAADGQTRMIPLAEILEIAPVSPPAAIATAPGAWLTLIDGSETTASEFLTAKDEATVALLTGVAIKLPLRGVAHVRLKPQSEAIAAQWAQILAKKPDGDLIVIRKKDALDYVEGVAGDVSAETVRFRLDGDNSNVKRTRVDGLVYLRTETELPTAICQVRDAAGGQWNVSTLRTSEDGTLQGTLCAGGEISLDWKHVQRIDFSRGKIVYLAEAPFEATQPAPTLRISKAEAQANARKFFRPLVDQAPGGASLRVNGRPFSRGICLHSPNQLAFRLAGKYSRLTALVGVDDVESGGAPVRLVIESGGQTLHDQVYQAGADPLPLDLDLRGVKTLTVRAEREGGSRISNYLDLCEAKLSK